VLIDLGEGGQFFAFKERSIMNDKGVVTGVYSCHIAAAAIAGTVCA
jgi:hypothetical protein